MARSSLIPGFRFHPTDVELVMYYLKRKLLRKKIIVNAVAEVNIYDFSPWDLPDKSSLRSGDLEWFFFCPKARKYSSGSRANRATETGFWKATGKDRVVKYKERSVAVIKTLVFHLGHAPNGERTDWVMHEYSMKDEHLANAGIIQDMYVLCKIFHKSGAGPKNGAQYGKPFNEEEWDDDVASCSESGAVLGPHGTINSLDYKQKDPTTLLQSTHAEPGSSTVTFSANETTNTLNCKQKGPAITNNTVPQGTRCLSLTKPGSSIVTCSAIETTNMLNYKRKGTVQSTRCLSLTEPGSSTVTFSANETTNMPNYKGKGAVPQSARSGSSTVTCSADMPNCKRKETVPQSIWCLSSLKPGSSAVTCSANERDLDVPASDDDVLLFEEIAASVMGGSTNKKEGVGVANERVKHVAPDEDLGIYDGLVNLVNLDDVYGAAPSTFKTDGADYTLNPIVTADDLDSDLRDFYVD